MAKFCFILLILYRYKCPATTAVVPERNLTNHTFASVTHSTKLNLLHHLKLIQRSTAPNSSVICLFNTDGSEYIEGLCAGRQSRVFNDSLTVFPLSSQPFLDGYGPPYGALYVLLFGML